MAKVIFVKDSEPFPYEFDGMFGKFMEGIGKGLESGTLNPSDITAIMSYVGQTNDAQPDKQDVSRFIAGDPYVNLVMIADAIAFYAKQSSNPEAFCGMVCDSAMRRCGTFEPQEPHIIVPDKRILH